MKKKNYSKILLFLMCFMISALIAMDFYLIMYSRGNQNLIPELILFASLFLEIGLLLQISRMNGSVLTGSEEMNLQ